MNPVKQLISYLKSSKEEFKKVTWPTRKQIIRYSALVIGVSVSISVFFALLDYGFTELIRVTLVQRAAEKAAITQTEQQPVVPTTEPQTSPKIDITNVEPIVTPVDNEANTTEPEKNN